MIFVEFDVLIDVIILLIIFNVWIVDVNNELFMISIIIWLNFCFIFLNILIVVFWIFLKDFKWSVLINIVMKKEINVRIKIFIVIFLINIFVIFILIINNSGNIGNIV